MTSKEASRRQTGGDDIPVRGDLLQQIVSSADQRLLNRIENSDIIPSAIYFDEIVPDSAEARRDYMSGALQALQEADLIFFDPDNGIEIKSKPKGRKDSSKFLYWDEIGQAYEAKIIERAECLPARFGMRVERTDHGSRARRGGTRICFTAHCGLYLDRTLESKRGQTSARQFITLSATSQMDVVPGAHR